MGLFSKLLGTDQESLLEKASNCYRCSEFVEILEKLDREHINRLYRKEYYCGFRIEWIVTNGYITSDIQESLMTRTDANVTHATYVEVIKKYRYSSNVSLIVKRFLLETDSELIELLRKCLEWNKISLPRDKDLDFVQKALDEYVDYYVESVNSNIIIDGVRSLGKRLTLHPDPVTEQERLTFKRWYAKDIKRYALKEIGWSELYNLCRTY